MPYKTNQDLPDSVKQHLPEHAQDIYRKAFNSAWVEYKDRKDREGTAHAVAWPAVEHEYHKDKDGKWVSNDQSEDDDAEPDSRSDS